MKNAVIKLPLNRWPYGLEVHPSADGILLRPRRKARQNWLKRFRSPRVSRDDLSSVRQFSNDFDAREWEW